MSQRVRQIRRVHVSDTARTVVEMLNLRLFGAVFEARKDERPIEMEMSPMQSVARGSEKDRPVEVAQHFDSSSEAIQVSGRVARQNKQLR